MTQISRRQLLGSSLAGGAALVASSFATAKETDMPAKWDKTFDVIVIGSGFAGLAAAIEAKAAGANVIVLDKMTILGGNSRINGGVMTATGCPQQVKAGVKDSPELLEQDILKAGLYLNNREKVRVMTQHALDNYNWCVNVLGVEFLPTTIAQLGGHSVKRTVTTKVGSGAGIVEPELAYCKKHGIPVQNKTFVEKIIIDDSGRAVGLKVREGYKFPKADSGKVQYYRATKGIVLCYGGFAHDMKFCQYQDPKITSDLDSTNQPGATSELWRETAALGALQVQNDWIQCGPWGNPREKGLGIAWPFNLHCAEYGVWVNTDGKRFVNELANRKIRADAIMVERSNGKECYSITNDAMIQALLKQRPGAVDKMLERGLIEKYNTLEEAAKAAKIDVKGLKAEIDRFNGYIKADKDPDFKRPISQGLEPIVKGPWYVGPLVPKVHHCMGGMVTDNDGRVISVLTDKPIPGLYAAGESTGGIHGAVRLGSVAILDCLVFGRIAGKTAATGK